MSSELLIDQLSPFVPKTGALLGLQIGIHMSRARNDFIEHNAERLHVGRSHPENCCLLEWHLHLLILIHLLMR